MEHADKWFSRAQHLIDHSVEADNLIFAIDNSYTKDKKLRHYLDDVKKRLIAMGIQAVNIGDEKQIAEFVRHH